MSEQDSIWSRFPPDLMGTVVLTGFAIVFTFAPIISATTLRVIFTGVFLLFAPGYTILAILFPESKDSDTESISIDTIERAGLSIPLSFVTVPVVGLMLNVSPLNFAVMPLTIILGVFVSGGCVIASWRRQSLPVTIQYRPQPRTRAAAFSNTLGQGMSTRSFLTITAVGLIILVSFSGAGYLFAAPGQGEAYTELYLGNETQNTTQSMKAYQTTYSVGDTQTLTVGISNREHQSMQYTLVSELQRVNNSTGTLQITERQELGRYSISLGSDQTWQRQDRIRPQLQGEQLRLIYYLYLDDSPSTPSVDTASQEVHLWISVTSS